MSEPMPPAVPRLTRSEAEVLAVVAEGVTSREAAGRLFVSKRTVDFHLANIHKKLGVTNRIAAVTKAQRLGLLPAQKGGCDERGG